METLAHRAGAVGSFLGAQLLELWLLRASFGLADTKFFCWSTPSRCVRELTLSRVLAPFGWFDLKRDRFETMPHMAGAECVNKKVSRY